MRKLLAVLVLLPFLAWGQRPTTDNPPLKYDPTTGAFVPSTTNGHTIGPDLTAYQTKAGVLALGGFSSITGTVPVANGGTGITSFGSGIATWLGTPSVANLKLALSDETTVVGNLLSLPNPSAISFIEIAADNTVSTRTPAQVLSDIGAAARVVYVLYLATDFTPSTDHVSETAVSLASVPAGRYMLSVTLLATTDDEAYPWLSAASQPTLIIEGGGWSTNGAFDAANYSASFLLTESALLMTNNNAISVSNAIIYNPALQTISLKFQRTANATLKAGSSVVLTKLD